MINASKVIEMFRGLIAEPDTLKYLDSICKKGWKTKKYWPIQVKHEYFSFDVEMKTPSSLHAPYGMTMMCDHVTGDPYSPLLKQDYWYIATIQVAKKLLKKDYLKEFELGLQELEVKNL